MNTDHRSDFFHAEMVKISRLEAAELLLALLKSYTEQYQHETNMSSRTELLLLMKKVLDQLVKYTE
jgi:hypothetical protein